jgi:hypothetical protein
MNCTVHPATAHQSTVSRIHDRIDGFLGDVAHLYNDPTIEKASRKIHVSVLNLLVRGYLSPQLVVATVILTTQDKRSRRISICLADEFKMLYPKGASFSTAGINSSND